MTIHLKLPPFNNNYTQVRIKEEIPMNEVEPEIKILARYEYEKELQNAELKNLKLQQKNNKVKQENNEYKKCIKKLNAIPNLHPEAKKIINSLSQSDITH